jgi:hypothetical protein
MPDVDLERRVRILEENMEALRDVPARLTAVESQIVQLRGEMQSGFSALRTADEDTRQVLRAEMRDLGTQLRSEMRELGAQLRGEMRTLNQETQTQMRVLHEEVISRIAPLHEGPGAAPRGGTRRPRKTRR